MIKTEKVKKNYNIHSLQYSSLFRQMTAQKKIRKKLNYTRHKETQQREQFLHKPHKRTFVHWSIGHPVA